jgi:DNA-binding MarR family transcriptional regulator
LAARREAPDARTVARDLLHAAMLLMRGVAAELRRTAAKPLAPGQMSTLMKIADGPCTLSRLARHQAVSLPTVSRSVDMLVRRGLVERGIDKADRRQTLVRLTQEGRDALADVRRRAEAYIQRNLETLEPDARQQMVAACQLLTTIFSTPGDDRS